MTTEAAMSIATCHTTDCAAAGVACTVDPALLDPGTTILCGACGQQITDISDGSDQETTGA